MKIKLYKLSALFLLLLLLGCSSEESYDYEGVYPVILDGIDGATEVNQTFTSDFSVSYSRGGSTWTWSAINATVSETSEDTRTATVLFEELPEDGYATIIVYETTEAGVKSEPDSLDVLVNQYCPLEDYSNDFVGKWTGTDGFDGYYYDSQVVISEATETGATIEGLNFGWVYNFWGETIQEGGAVPLIINDDGTLEIESQYYFTTLYSGALYEYTLAGEGTWSNCGDKLSMVIEYTLYNSTDGYELPSYYYSYETFTATLEIE